LVARCFRSADAEDEEGLKERVGTNLPHAEFALAGDDEKTNAEIAEGVTVQDEGCRKEGAWTG